MVGTGGTFVLRGGGYHVIPAEQPQALTSPSVVIGRRSRKMEDKKPKPNKKPYTSPKLTVFGDVEVITKGGTTGDFLDAAFPAGTPRGRLTYGS
jgi:hypothetical protein